MIRFLFVIIAFCILPSCSFDLLDEECGMDLRKVGIHIGSAQTRTQMLPNGLSAEWSAGDELAVWARDASGGFVLSNQIFTTYGLDSSRGFFTSTLDEDMPEGTYTYMSCYPNPISVSGTTATFYLPDVQDGKVSGGADIMIATPAQYGALTGIPDPEDHSGISMTMNRMMHQFRFWFPQEYDLTNEGILEITLTTPQNIAGMFTADIASPSTSPVLTNGVNTIHLDLAEPLASSESLDNAGFACVSVYPYDGVYTDSDYMNLTVYSQRYKFTVDPVSLSGRTFAAGHSTPVRIIPTGLEEYYRLTLKIGDNYIGEHLTNVSVLLDGTDVFYGFDATGEPYANYTNSVEAYGTDGKDAYDSIISSVQAGTATYIYETENTLVTRPITTDMMTYDGNRIVVDLGDVPYLLDEDFSAAHASAHDDDYAGSADSDMNLGGYLLDGYMPLNGWNASRYQILEGDCVRINCRYQSGAWIVGRYCGRLDTPTFKYLKPGVSVNVVLEYDYAFYIPTGYNRDDSATDIAKYHIGTHTKSETSAIDGDNSNDLSTAASIFYTSGLHPSGSVSRMTPMSHTVTAVTPSTRIVFFPDTDRTTSVLAANSVYYLYLDNIKVYIND